ncbi:MAG: 1-deoxy-D-xylulose-5-phosphate reductoisomerase [Clostridiales bacterium]|jgi:1-deoxy-D-xylulose-5-phosphate reductoisomerase|nr:1-deoxy-D-xylulose-5-phosphate reductoisomerase [Clostridiales bacterium]
MKIGIFGSSGSVGAQTLDVIRANRGGFEVMFLSAHTNTDKLAMQAAEFLPPFVAVTGENAENKKTLFLKKLREIKSIKGAPQGYNPVVICGKEYYKEIFKACKTDIAVIAVTGLSGLLPSYYALKNGIKTAIANKETLVAGGALIMKEAEAKGLPVIPIDSEHSAIAECLKAGGHSGIKRLILTASGGPFRAYTPEMLRSAVAADALKHPIWNMGKKVTADSATMMNKGMEIIEAAHLFGMPESKIDVVVHPESVVHSMVEYSDNAVIAMLSVPDMRVSISRALGINGLLKNDAGSLDLVKLKKLTFEEPDTDKFPCLDLARQALRAGGIIPAAMNAANEIAVDEFLSGKAGFNDIPIRISRVLQKTVNFEPKSIEDISEADRRARELYAALN